MNLHSLPEPKSSLFKRDAKDRRPPGRKVTRSLMGDPIPGRTPWAAE